ncbi:autophagy-related protein 16 isoform X2 [Alligator mississippiensis]|uniref:autophagy-related protein 16 isoform X2 n=1 Tax=Alligator mississippiensis TaxID=8496 RepID=UPI00090718B2|nr:autophagy-related protein 16 isoform X2 [Alligator mississippiensis]
MAGVGPGPGWRSHVRAELQRREREQRGLRDLVRTHEKLLERLDLQSLLAEKLQLDTGTQESGAALDLASLQLQHALEVSELQQGQEELAQTIADLTEALTRSEAETREQRERAGRCARALAALSSRAEEAEALRAALGVAQEQVAALEARWVQEKAAEAARVNQANAQLERYQHQVLRLRQKLEQLQLAAAGIKLGTSDSSCSTSCLGGARLWPPGQLITHESPGIPHQDPCPSAE